MSKEKVSKFFKVYKKNQAYKVFLDDVSAIYKVHKKKTPLLIPYFESSDDMSNPNKLRIAEN